MNAQADAAAIFRAGLAGVDPLVLLERGLRLDGEILRVTTETVEASYDLSHYRRLFVLGAGKASARLALGVERLLGARLTDGLVVVKDGGQEPLARVRLLVAGHPVPDERSVRAARAVLALAGQAGPDDLVIVLLSGGGSALLAAPLALPGREALPLADKQAVTRALLACGASIQEINRVRKKLSAIKGGRLAQAIAPARCLTLALSDVVGDDPDVIASGPTVFDPTSPGAGLEVLRRYDLCGRVPATAERLLRAVADGRAPDTPKADDPAFAKTRTVLLGTNFQALLAARDAARALGYRTLVLTSRLTGEARELAHLFWGLAQDMTAHGLPLIPPACILSGGETTVILRGPGRGGRNQEMALAYLDGLARHMQPDGGAVFLAASTDGGDGPTPAAGAFASWPILQRGRALGLDPAAFLARNDSYRYFKAVGQLFVTGPTKTNVCDIQVLVSPASPHLTDTAGLP